MHQFTNWQYGYTLGPPSIENGGDYTIFTNPPPPGTEGSALVPPVVAPVPAPKQENWEAAQDKLIGLRPKSFVTASNPTDGTGSSSLSSLPPGTAGPVLPSTLDEKSNAVAKVHDLATFNRVLDKYESKEDPQTKTFSVTLTLGPEQYTGTGTSIKAAKQNAALQALASTNLTMKKTMKARPNNVTATSQLHEMATKRGLSVDFKFIEPFNFKYHASMKIWKREEMRGVYRVQLKVGEMEFTGNGEFPQEAKHHASMQAIPFLRSIPEQNSKVSLTTSSTTTNQDQDQSTSSTPSSSSSAMPPGKNPIMFLNELAMSRHTSIEWIEGESSTTGLNQRSFTWKVKMGDYEAVGVGNNKKSAKYAAAQNMIMALPDEMKQPVPKVKKKNNNTQRKRPAAAMAMGMPPPPGFFPPFPCPGPVIDPFVPPMPTPVPSAPSQTPTDASSPKAAKQPKVEPEPKPQMPVYKVINASNPISCLYEYAKKVKVSDPAFDCISENVIDTWQKGGHTFKKTEYTMRLEIKGQTYFATGNTKKVAKTRVAEEAWNLLRAEMMP